VTLRSALGAGVNSVSNEVVDPLGKFLGLQTVSASRHGSAIVGPPRRRPAALFGRGAGPLTLRRRSAPRGWVAERIGAVDSEERVVEWAGVSAARSVDGRELFEGFGERTSQGRCLAAVQKRDRRRRGRPGDEAAVSNVQEVAVGSRWGRVVSSSLLMKGLRVGAGAAQGSLSNHPLQPTACGRLGASSRPRSHAAAERGR
jgi:hypothetical protein